jgi:hypothetical protein
MKLWTKNQVAYQTVLSRHVLCWSGLHVDLEQDQHLVKDLGSLRSLRQTGTVTQSKSLTDIAITLEILPNTINSLTDGNATLGANIVCPVRLDRCCCDNYNLLQVIMCLISTLN